jgi:hypothetical protein
MTVILLCLLVAILSGVGGYKASGYQLSATKQRLLEARTALELETSVKEEPEPYKKWKTWFGPGKDYGLTDGCVFGVYYQAATGAAKTSHTVNFKVPFNDPKDNHPYEERLIGARAANKRICKTLNCTDDET